MFHWQQFNDEIRIRTIVGTDQLVSIHGTNVILIEARHCSRERERDGFVTKTALMVRILLRQRES